MNLPSEKVRHGGEVADCRRRALRPIAIENDVVLRHDRGNFLDMEQADVWIFRRGNLVFRIGGLRHRPFHIRLTRRHPDFANEDIFQRNLVLAPDQQFVRPTRRHLLEFDGPLAIHTGFRRGLIVAERDRYVLTCVGRAPDRQRYFLLQDHVACNDLRQRNVGVRETAHAEQADDSHD